MNSSELQPADILVAINDRGDLYSRIKRCAVGPYEHVFMYLGRLGLFLNHRQRRILRVPMLFEANHDKGVCLRLLAERFGEKVVVMRLKSEHDRRRIPYVLRAAIELASDDQSRYDYASIPLHIIPRILHEKLGMPIPLRYHRNPEQICSEACWEVYHRASVDILPQGVVPLPGDFVTDSPLLEEVWRGELSAEVI